MTDYAGNSNKNKQMRDPVNDPPEKPVIEKVVIGEVVVKKRSIGSKFKHVFFGGDSKSALQYIAADVLLPAIRSLLVEASTKGVERLVFGEERRGPRRPTGFDYRSRVQYNSPIARTELRGARLPDQPPLPMRGQQRDTDGLILASRDEAEMVLERMIDILDKYGVATVADLHDLTGLPTSHIDNKWGWVNLNTSEVQQVREGWLLNLPKAEEVN